MGIEKKEKLRVGILLDGFLLPAWIYSMIEKINAGDYAEFVLVVKKRVGQHQVARPSKIEKIRNQLPYLSYIIYSKIENKLFKPQPAVFAMKDASALIGNVPFLEVTPIEKKFSDTVEGTDIEKIKQYNVDVFIRLGFRILKGDILHAAKFGVWSYHHGDNRINRGTPPGLWETIEGWRETGFILQILTESLDDGTILYRSSSQKEKSLNRNLHNLYWKAMPVLPQKLKELYNAGGEAFMKKAKAENNQLSFYSNRLYTAPKNFELISRVLKQQFKWMKDKFVSLFYFKQWILLYCFNTEKKPATSLFRYKRLTPPKDRFWADPCLIYRDNKYFIFFEELIYRKHEYRAHISVIEMDTKGVYQQPEIVLERSYHLSYPFVFSHKGEYYMIPETIGNSTIELYKSISFPNKWEPVINLKENIKAVDTTIFEKDDKIWMFSYVQENKDVLVFELFLYYADRLATKEWISHPKNPIVTDIKTARPAGKLLFQNGKLYRPSQDCSYVYGYATVINEVIVMNTEDYEEKPVSDILPNWNKDIIGTHSFSHDEKLTVVDAYIKRRK